MPTRKFDIGDKVVGNQKKASFHGQKGKIIRHESNSQYWVEFDDGKRESVYSWWLDKQPSDNPR